METSLTLNRENQVTQDLGKGLENAYKEAKELDTQIAKSLAYHVSPLKNIPILNKFAYILFRVKPLNTLEFMLRRSINKSLVSLAKVGQESQKEKEKIESLEEIITTAKEQQWNTHQFLSFIENNTDLDYKVQADGQEYDFKEVIARSEILSQTKGEMHTEYMDWLENHVQLRKDYQKSMDLLVALGSKWVGNSSRSYFDLTQLRGGMEQIRKTIEYLGDGAVASHSSQQALQEYGKAHVNAMKRLNDGYQQLVELRKKGTNGFTEAINQLEGTLKGAQLQLKATTPTRYKLPEPAEKVTVEAETKLNAYKR